MAYFTYFTFFTLYYACLSVLKATWCNFFLCFCLQVVVGGKSGLMGNVDGPAIVSSRIESDDWDAGEFVFFCFKNK